MLTALSFDSYISLSNFIHTVNNFFEKVFQLFMLTVLSFDSHISLSNFIYTVNNFFNLFYKKMKPHLSSQVQQVHW